MKKAYFCQDTVIGEDGAKINEKALEFECLKNAGTSLRVIEIIIISIKKFGYELEITGFTYRKNELFNDLERKIVKSSKYQTLKQQKSRKTGENSPSPNLRVLVDYTRDRDIKFRKEEIRQRKFGMR